MKIRDYISFNGYTSYREENCHRKLAVELNKINKFEQCITE